MKKVRLLVIIFFLSMTFTACNTSDSLDQLIQDTEIETPENTDDEEEVEKTT